MRIDAHGSKGLVTAPNALAAHVGAALLRHGANAVEAAIGVSAALSVVYPHMTGIGGDAFWLISDGCAQSIRGLAAAGPAGRSYTPDLFRKRGFHDIPYRGALSAMTVPGMLRGWEEAYGFSKEFWGGKMSWGDMLEPARELADHGFPMSNSQVKNWNLYCQELQGDADFLAQYDPQEPTGAEGVWRQPKLARTIQCLMEEGPAEFYEGDLANQMVTALGAKGSQLKLEDLRDFRAEWVTPLSISFGGGQLFNLPPPSQGIASLMIAGIMERMGLASVDPLGAELVHAAVEVTKRVFPLRDQIVIDPHFDVFGEGNWQEILSGGYLDEHARILGQSSKPSKLQWHSEPGDTTWFGVVDSDGRVVSVIQSLYHEFGSGVVAGVSGVLWNNRGCAFSLNDQDPKILVPGKRPFHTLNPALFAKEGKICMAYGSMGGDGQPQTQAAILFRHLFHGLVPAAAVDAPRWLLGRTWGEPVTALRLESRYAKDVIARLRGWGHAIQVVGPYSDVMGHAGLLSVQENNVWQGACDPRSDGAVLSPEN